MQLISLMKNIFVLCESLYVHLVGGEVVRRRCEICNLSSHATQLSFHYRTIVPLSGGNQHWSNRDINKTYSVTVISRALNISLIGRKNGVSEEAIVINAQMELG